MVCQTRSELGNMLPPCLPDLEDRGLDLVVPMAAP